jgi:hypothetical protein
METNEGETDVESVGESEKQLWYREKTRETIRFLCIWTEISCGYSLFQIMRCIDRCYTCVIWRVPSSYRMVSNIWTQLQQFRNHGSDTECVKWLAWKLFKTACPSMQNICKILTQSSSANLHTIKFDVWNKYVTRTQHSSSKIKECVAHYRSCCSTTKLQPRPSQLVESQLILCICECGTAANRKLCN